MVGLDPSTAWHSAYANQNGQSASNDYGPFRRGGSLRLPHPLQRRLDERVRVGNIPIIGRLMENTATSLDSTQQTSLALWTVMKAMVLDAVNAKNRGHFFTRNECEALPLQRKIPDKTVVQIGTYVRSGYSADGTIVWLDFPNAPKAAKASVSTFVIGHLVIQVVTVHHEPEHENDPVGTVAIGDGEWDKLLLRIWPAGTLPVAWPPQATFANSGSSSILTLQNRWRLGKDATI